MSYREDKKFAGHRDQLFQARHVQMMDGKAKNVELIEVSNRSGMHFAVNISRGLDITYMDYQGENIGFITPCGVVAPEYFDDRELGFLKSFTGGLMMTCGPKMTGAPCEYEGKEYGLHGNASHTPAENVSCEIVEDGDDAYVQIRGTLRDAVIFGDKLRLDRVITCRYKDRFVSVKDTVTNEGYKTARHMILYHCNIGYPILAPDSEIFIPAEKTVARTAHAEEGFSEWMKACEPDPDYEEMCYYHTLKKNSAGYSAAAVYNPELNKGIAIQFDTSTLDHFLQWKMMGAGDYVMGLEPGNSTIDGIADAIENGSMKYLKPGESTTYQLGFRVIDGKDEFEAIKQLK